MKKIYYSAQLQIVTLNANNVIATSGLTMSGDHDSNVETIGDDYASNGYSISW